MLGVALIVRTLLFASFAFASSNRAVCVVPQNQALTASASMVFIGVAVRLDTIARHRDRELVTFAVDRAWKGVWSDTVALPHVLHTLDSGTYTLERRYLVATTGPDGDLLIDDCVSGPITEPWVQRHVRLLGRPSWTPRH